MDNGFKVLMWLEGNRDQVYKDHAGYNTVCMGILAPDLQVGTKVNNCRELNVKYYEKYKRAVLKYVKRDIADHQLHAFTNMSFNIGRSGFKKSSALRAFNLRKPDYIVAANMQKWNKITVNGRKQIDPILVKRRALEAAMFQSAHYASRAEYLAAAGAPRPVRPDSEGLLSLFKKSKTNWASSAVGVMGGGAGLFSQLLNKIHPFTVNAMMITIFVLAIYLIFNRYRDSAIGEHF